jgi:hypothetical protein
MKHLIFLISDILKTPLGVLPTVLQKMMTRKIAILCRTTALLPAALLKPAVALAISALVLFPTHMRLGAAEFLRTATSVQKDAPAAEHLRLNLVLEFKGFYAGQISTDGKKLLMVGHDRVPVSRSCTTTSTASSSRQTTGI